MWSTQLGLYRCHAHTVGFNIDLPTKYEPAILSGRPDIIRIAEAGFSDREFLILFKNSCLDGASATRLMLRAEFGK